MKHTKHKAYTDKEMPYSTDLKRIRGKKEETWCGKKRIGDIKLP